MFSETQREIAQALLAMARAAGLRIATAESCTGGLIAALLTEIPGSSDVVERGFVTYSNDAKTDMLGVPAALAQQGLSPATDNPFLSVPPAASGELRFGAQLPEFEAKDVSGRAWRNQDLRGKFTLLYVWHTFDARARDKIDPHAREVLQHLPELPEVQRFYDQVRNGKNIQVLTFCLDYDYTHAPEYLKEHKYTFPVIADWVLIKKLFPTGEREWLVNPEGRLSYPFRSWSFGQLLFAVERAAARNE